MNKSEARPSPSVDQFDSRARAWDQNPMRVELASAVAKAVTEAIPPDPNRAVLDFGGGAGLVALPLAPQVASVTVADSSREMLAVLMERAQAAGVDNVQPLFLPEEGEPEIDGPYGLVLASMVMHHIDDTAGMLRRISTWTGPGGWVAIADLEAEDGSFHSPEQTWVHNGFDPSELGAHAEQSGFAVSEIRTIHTIHRPDRGESGRDYPVFLLTAQKRR